MTSASAKDLARQLTNIADASRRGDGSDIPLGEIIRRAAALLTRYAEAEGELETTEEERQHWSEVLANGPNWITGEQSRKLLRDLTRLTAHVAALRAERDAANARAERLAGALKAVEPYIGAIVCYASTINEHDGNRVAALIRALLTEPESKGGDPAPVPATTEKTDD